MQRSSPDELLAAEIRRREETDYHYDWWTYVGWNILTCGVYSHFATYKLVARRTEHARRRIAFSSYLWHTLAGRADAFGQREIVQEGLDNLARIHAQIESYERLNKREPVLWLVLRIVFTPVGIFINHFLNADLRFLDTWETSQAQNAEWVMQKLGCPVGIPTRRPVEARSTGMYVLLTIVTLGLYAIYWRYAMMIDGNLHFEEDAKMEDAIARALALPSGVPSVPAMPPGPAF